jgi:hypothetical protein
MRQLPSDAWIIAGPLVLCLYYFFAWLLVGRELKRGAAVVRYDPPQGVTPAAARYLWTKGSDGRSLAAVLADLSARGIVRITPGQGDYKVEQLLAAKTDSASLPPEEKRVCGLLFSDQSAVILRPKEQGPLSLYLYGIHEELTKQVQGKYYTWNLGYLVGGAIAALAFMLGAAGAVAQSDAFTAVFFCLWFLFCGWILGLIAVVNVLPAWERLLRGMGGIRQVLVSTLITGAFCTVMGIVLLREAQATSAMLAVALVLMLLLPLVWGPALRRMNPLGVQMLGELEGFRTFLQEVEQDRLQRLNAPDEVLKKANQFLPYAIALEVREAWGDHLADNFEWVTTQH